MEARQIFDKYIEELGKRKTPERYVIMELMLGSPGHHSADDVCAMLPNSYPISRATVYSTLSLLDDAGLVYSHQINGKTLYESAFGREPHHHYICKGCGKIWEFMDANVSDAVAVCKTPRFRKSHSSLYIYGVCNSCYARIYRLRKKLEKKKLEKMTEEEKRFARISEELFEASKWINPKK